MPFRAPALAVLLVASALAAGAGAASAAGRAARFGALTVEQGAKPGPDGPEEDRLHLRWRSADGQATLELIDDGEELRAEVGVRFCRVTIQYQKYERRSGEPHLRRRLSGMMADMAEYCRTPPEADRARYRSEYEAAEDDFPAAIEAMKHRAILLFDADLTRCRQPRIRNRPIRIIQRCERRE